MAKDGEKILIVEDSETQTAYLKKFLEEKGYRVSAAKNGAEGLDMARRDSPSLIISDIVMPVMDGYRMCREIKDSDALKDIPVILLTQLTESEDIMKGLESGAESYVAKPYHPEYLLAEAEALIENPVRFVNRPSEKGVEVIYGGRRHIVRSGRSQTLSFLLSTYENVVYQFRQMNKMSEELKVLNESLEEKVRERTEALTREIDERKSAEKALRKSEERFRTLVESASDAVVCLEPPGTIYVWNRKAEEMFGYSAAEAIGRDYHRLVVPERHREAALKGLKSFFETGEGRLIGKTVEIEALRKDGTEFPVELSIAAVKTMGVWDSVGIIRDITARRSLEEEMKRNLDDVERMNRLMVGRELKMEDLREEVRILRARLEEASGGLRGRKEGV